jgi:site-specific DNA-methyltransferase (adenine-specific)/modification methylase
MTDSYENEVNSMPISNTVVAEPMATQQTQLDFFPTVVVALPIERKATSNIDGLLNRVFEADCLEKMRDIPDRSIDMILCDLPYGMTQNAWDSYISLDRLWAQYLRIIKQNGVVALTSHGVFTAKLILSQEKLFKYKWVWEKSKPINFLNAKKQPLRKHEDVCVFYQHQPTYHPQMTRGTAYDKV